MLPYKKNPIFYEEFGALREQHFLISRNIIFIKEPADPNLLKLVQYSHPIPMSNASVETIFSLVTTQTPRISQQPFIGCL